LDPATIKIAWSEDSRMALKYIYSLTNLSFIGTRVTECLDGSWRRDALDFRYKDMRCTLKQIEGYASLIEELKETHGSAVTATLTLESEERHTLKEMDDLSDSICELLAFSTKNEVFWIEREIVRPKEGEPSRHRRSLGGRVRDFHSGWAIIDDIVATNNGNRSELQIFLGAVLERYHDSLRDKLKLPLLWIIEAEHYGFVDLQYMCLYIAIERLRIDFLSKKANEFIHADWQALLDGELGLEILRVVEERIGTLAPEQKRALISKLRGANSPPAAVLLEELCTELRVIGLEKDMGVLRNKLTHTASYGNFDFPKVLDLHVKLSHVVDVCVLKILGYDGYYCHRATAWRNILLGQQPPSEESGGEDIAEPR
jgi:hypothetical protein